MSSDADKQSKTFDPTPARLAKARQDGQVAKSREVSTAATVFFAGIGVWLIGLIKNLQAAAEQIVADLFQGQFAFADFLQFLGGKEDCLLGFDLKGKEFGQTDRNTVQNALQGTDGGIDFAGLDL